MKMRTNINGEDGDVEKEDAVAGGGVTSSSGARRRVLEFPAALVHGNDTIHFSSLIAAQMETGAEQLIHEWLANVPEAAPSQPDCEGLNAADLEPNGGLPTVLEPTDTGPAIRWPKINKRPRNDNAEHGQRDPQESTENRYEKKPRRKTRDDKYEYKRPSPSKQRTSQPHKDKGKRSRKSRKHMMNDAFHATNVARERLTLRNTMNMGIFSKGKASSPIKLRDVPDTAFSEAQFLSHKERGQSGTGPGKDTPFDESPLQKNPDGKHPHPRVSHFLFHGPPKLVRSETYLADTANPSMQSSQRDQCHPSGSKGVVPSPPAAGATPQDHLTNTPGNAHDIHSQPRPSIQESPSPTPYTWSVSDRYGSQRSREVEDRLLKILHVGLSPQKSGHQDESVDTLNGYCNIKDLKKLLDNRKACWQQEASPVLHSLGRVTTHQETHEFISSLSGATQTPAKVSLFRLKHSDAVSKSENKTCHRQASPDDVCRDSRHDQSHGHEVDVSNKVLLSSQPRLRAGVLGKLAGLDVGDDDIFFQELDAAYCAILEPESTRNEPLEEELVECNKSRPSISFQSLNQDLSPVGTIDTLLCGQVGLDVLTTLANSSHRPELVAFSSRGKFTKMNALELTSTKEGVGRGPAVLFRSHPSNPLPSKTVPESCSPIPPGFWTQKRLY